MAAAAAVLGALMLAAPPAAAPPPLSLSARPTVVTAEDTVQLFGRLSNGVTGQTIQIEMSDCNGTAGASSTTRRPGASARGAPRCIRT